MLSFIYKDTLTINPSKDITVYACLSLAFLIGSFSLTMPYLQARRDELQCDSFCQGSLTSLRSILSLVGSTLMGRISDLVIQRQWFQSGRSICLFIGNVASLVGLILSITIPTKRGLWFSLIPGALFQQNFSILKAMITESLATTPSCDQKDDDGFTRDKKKMDIRTASFGKLGMSAGVAFMIGPFMGAILVTNFTNATYWAMCMIFISTCFLFQISTIVREQNKQRNNVENNNSSKDIITISSSSLSSNKSSNNGNIISLKTVWKQISLSTSIPGDTWSLFWNTKKTLWSRENTPAWLQPAALFLMSIRLCMALAFHIFQLIWTVSLKRRFNFTPSDHGKFMSFVGLTYALSQGFVAKRIVSTFASTYTPCSTTTAESIHEMKSDNNSKKSSDHQQRQRRVRVIQVCCIILGLGRYLAFHTTHLMVVYFLFGLIITSLGVMNTILTSDTSSIAPISQMGSLYGVMESVESASGILGPFLGGIIQHPLLSVLFMYTLVFLLITFGYDRFIILNKIEMDDVKKRT